MESDDALVLSLAQREALYNYRAVQETRTWATPRTGDMPDPPWPSALNPMLDFIVHCGAEYAKDDVQEGLAYVAIHAWMEGHIEGYDRAMSGAATPSGIPAGPRRRPQKSRAPRPGSYVIDRLADRGWEVRIYDSTAGAMVLFDTFATKTAALLHIKDLKPIMAKGASLREATDEVAQRDQEVAARITAMFEIGRQD